MTRKPKMQMVEAMGIQTKKFVTLDPIWVALWERIASGKYTYFNTPKPEITAWNLTLFIISYCNNDN